jgi:hypothetical protein
MYNAQADLAKNRLVITLVGLLSDEETRLAVDAVLAEAKRLRPPFDLINDMSNLRPISQVGLAEIRRAMTSLAEMGLRQVVRVTGVSSVVQLQFKRETQGAYPVELVPSLAEAHAFLDTLPHP